MGKQQSNPPHHQFRRRKTIFSAFANRIALGAGRPAAFFLAVGLIVVWLLTGPMFDFSNTWQLVVNTGTTIITFLMVFLIQHTQNRDAYSMQLKLDELIRAMKGAHTALLDIEEMSDKELLEVQERYQELAAKARHRLNRGRSDTGSPEVKLN